MGVEVGVAVGVGTGVAVATSVAVGTGGVGVFVGTGVHVGTGVGVRVGTGVHVGSGVHVGTSVGSGIGALSLPPPQATSNRSVAGIRSSRMALSFMQPYYPKCLLGNTFPSITVTGLYDIDLSAS